MQIQNICNLPFGAKPCTGGEKDAPVSEAFTALLAVLSGEQDDSPAGCLGFCVQQAGTGEKDAPVPTNLEQEQQTPEGKLSPDTVCPCLISIPAMETPVFGIIPACQDTEADVAGTAAFTADHLFAGHQVNPYPEQQGTKMEAGVAETDAIADDLFAGQQADPYPEQQGNKMEAGVLPAASPDNNVPLQDADGANQEEGHLPKASADIIVKHTVQEEISHHFLERNAAMEHSHVFKKPEEMPGNARRPRDEPLMPFQGRPDFPARMALQTTAAEFGRLNTVRAEVVDQILEKMIFNREESGESSVLIRLKPAVLGKVEIRLSMEEGNLTGRILTENLQVKEALEAALAPLRQRLENQHIHVSELTVSVSNQEGFAGRRGYTKERHQAGKVSVKPVADIKQSSLSPAKGVGLVDLLA